MLRGEIDAFLRQDVDDVTPFEQTVQTLVSIANRPDPTRRQQKPSR